MMNRIAVLLPEEYRGVYSLTLREDRPAATESAPVTDAPD